MSLRFDKEDMPTAGGFVRDSFLADQADFVAVAPADFDAAFAADLQAKLHRVAQATGAALRTGAGTQTTTRLYQNLDALRPYLDRLDIRLGLLPAKDLKVPAKSFGLKRLRERIDSRDVEAVSKALTTLQQAIADDLDALKTKGYTTQEQTDLHDLHKKIDEDNGKQNTNLNTSTKTTQVENADYKALDELLGKVMCTGRLLYKNDKARRRQYEVTAILKRVHAPGPGPDGDAQA